MTRERAVSFESGGDVSFARGGGGESDNRRHRKKNRDMVPECSLCSRLSLEKVPRSCRCKLGFFLATKFRTCISDASTIGRVALWVGLSLSQIQPVGNQRLRTAPPRRPRRQWFSAMIRRFISMFQLSSWCAVSILGPEQTRFWVHQEGWSEHDGKTWD